MRWPRRVIGRNQSRWKRLVFVRRNLRARKRNRNALPTFFVRPGRMIVSLAKTTLRGWSAWASQPREYGARETRRSDGHVVIRWRDRGYRHQYRYNVGRVDFQQNKNRKIVVRIPRHRRLRFTAGFIRCFIQICCCQVLLLRVPTRFAAVEMLLTLVYSLPRTTLGRRPMVSVTVMSVVMMVM